MPDDVLSGLWNSLSGAGEAVGKGLEGLWDHLKSGHAKAEAALPKPMQKIEEGVGAVAGDVGDIAKGMFEAGPGTLKKIAEGEVEPGSSEMAEAGRQTALTYGAGGAPRGALGMGLGRGPGIRAPGFEAHTTPLPPGELPGAADLARGTAHAIEQMVSPTTMDTAAKMAEASIDKSLGQARRETAVANAQLEQSRKLTAPLMPEFQGYVRDVQHGLATGAYAPGGIPKPSALRFLDYMEGRSKGATLDPEIAHLKPLADTMRKIVEDRRAAIAADPLTNVQSFIEDYYSHQWAEKARVPTLLYGTRPRMGSGGALQKRSIPTISEGIDLGLTPTSFDPIETTMRYVANMDRFLASNEIFATGQSSGMIKFHRPGEAPAGWTPLQGRLAGPTPYGMQAFAPEGYARVYNRSAHVDPGWANAPAFQAWNMAKNSLTQTLLGFSGYHYLAMAQESITSKLGQAIGDVGAGDLRRAAKNAGLAMSPTLVPQQLAKGRKVQQAYLRQLDPSDPAAPLYERIASDIAGAGGRMVGRGEEWRGSAMADYWTAIRRGTLANELRLGMRNVAEGPISTSPLRAGAMFFREVGRIMETVNKPLFDHVVPQLKGAAFFDEMESWLARNPNAGRAEELGQARKLWDSMDDRFGEMVMDRVFWNQRLKQVLQSVMVSPGWEIGSARAIGGGVADIARGQWTPRTRWLIALPAIVGLTDAVYQYLRTGKPPGSVTDLMAPQTGGTTPEGMPERAILPGYEKDPIGWFKDPIAKIAGMQNPAMKMGQEVLTGRDQFTGRPIVEDFPGAPSGLQQWGKHILQNYTPIPIQQAQRGGLPGSALGPVSNVLGIRPAPGEFTDPDRTRELRKAHSLSETIKSLGSQIFDAKRRGNLDDVKKLMKERHDAQMEQRRIFQQQRARQGAMRQDTLRMSQ